MPDQPVRPASLADAPALSRLAVRAFPEACPPGTPPADIEAYCQAELTPERFTEHLNTYDLLVVDDAVRPGELAGYAMLCRLPIPAQVSASNPVELKRIYVDPTLIGSGVGAALMRASLDRAEAGEHDVVWLGTNQENRRAIGFYRRFGFEVVGERTFQVGRRIEEDFVLVRGGGLLSRPR